MERRNVYPVQRRVGLKLGGSRQSSPVLILLSQNYGIHDASCITILHSTSPDKAKRAFDTSLGQRSKHRVSTKRLEVRPLITAYRKSQRDIQKSMSRLFVLQYLQPQLMDPYRRLTAYGIVQYARIHDPPLEVGGNYPRLVGLYPPTHY